MLPARIAMRYLHIRRAHGAVSAIAAVSVAGIAVAVAAIVCVLSVFNGFRDTLCSRSSGVLPDIEIRPAQGRTIADADSLAAVVGNAPDVAVASPLISDQVLAIFGGREIAVDILSADYAALRRLTRIDSILLPDSRFPSEDVDFDSTPEGLVSIGAASRLGAYSPGDVIFLFAPRRFGQINTANPAMGFVTDSIAATGVFESGDNDFDDATLIVPPEVARALLMYDDREASAVAVALREPQRAESVAAALAGRLGSGYDVATREARQSVAFRMVNIEKWATFLLLAFIMLIAGFNIISTMTMYVLEKRRAIATFRALGMRPKSIGSIFGWQSIYVTLLGAAVGLILGTLLVLLQSRYSLLTLGHNLDGTPIPYPVRLLPTDLLAALIPTLLIGLLTALIASRFALSQASRRTT